MKILVLDNYDSFTYNLVHILKALGKNVTVFRNDKIQLEKINAYDKILLSPGPSLPKDAGIMQDLIAHYAPNKSILGVCLGHQGIAEYFGGKLFNIGDVLHGIPKKTIVKTPTDLLFKNMPSEFMAGRYHSWAVKKETLEPNLILTATDEDEQVMAFAHKNYDVRGVQFHPESILTEFGQTIIKNWLKI